MTATYVMYPILLHEAFSSFLCPTREGLVGDPLPDVGIGSISKASNAVHLVLYLSRYEDAFLRFIT